MLSGKLRIMMINAKKRERRNDDPNDICIIRCDSFGNRERASGRSFVEIHCIATRKTISAK